MRIHSCDAPFISKSLGNICFHYQKPARDDTALQFINVLMKKHNRQKITYYIFALFDWKNKSTLSFGGPLNLPKFFVPYI